MCRSRNEYAIDCSRSDRTQQRDFAALEAIVFVEETATENYSGAMFRGLQMDRNRFVILVRNFGLLAFENYLIYCKQRLVSRELFRLARRIHRSMADVALAVSTLSCKTYSNYRVEHHHMWGHRVDRS